MKGYYNIYKGIGNSGKNEWEERLRKRLENYEAAPPEGLWESIEAKLSNEKPAKKRVLIPLKWWIASAAAVVLAVIFIPNDKPTQPVHKLTAEQVVRKNNAIPVQDITTVQENHVKVNREKLQINEKRISLHGDTHETIPKEAIILNKDTAKVPVDKDITPNKESRFTTQSEPLLPTRTETFKEENVPIITTKSSRWSVMAYASNGLMDFDSRTNIHMSDEIVMLFRTPEASSNGTNLHRQKEIFLDNYSENVRHHQPISVGLSIAYNFSRHWQVASGINYTFLQSDFTNVVDGYEIERKQRLHYIGIPISLHYNFWTHKRWILYGGFGTQIDINCKAETENNYVKKDIGKDHIQWSADAKAGIEYNVLPHLAFYMEPGIKYYFDNKSDVNNLFKERPLNYNLQFGIRINLKK